nr:preprotein translocase subunit SecE [Microlunatus panaciterrae]
MDEQGAVEDQLVSVGAAQRRAARDREAGKERSAAAKGRGKKDKATPKQRQAARTQRTGPVKFVNEAIGELRKVVYPTGQQLLNYFVVVLVFVLFIIGIVSLLDLGFGWAILKIFS